MRYLLTMMFVLAGCGQEVPDCVTPVEGYGFADCTALDHSIMQALEAFEGHVVEGGDRAGETLWTREAMDQALQGVRIEMMGEAEFYGRFDPEAKGISFPSKKTIYLLSTQSLPHELGHVFDYWVSGNVDGRPIDCAGAFGCDDDHPWWTERGIYRAIKTATRP